MPRKRTPAWVVPVRAWVLATLAILGGSAGGQEGDILQQATVHGDRVNLDLPRQCLQAEGDVVLTYQDVWVEAGRVELDFVAQRLVAEDGVQAVLRGRYLVGQSLRYTFGDRIGLLDDAIVDMDGVIFHAEKITVTGDDLQIRNTSLTTCNRPHPHYQIRVRGLQLVKDKGARCNHAAIWYGKRRLVTLPNITINLSRKERAQKKPMSIVPTTMFNSNDGIMLQAKLNWNPIPPTWGMRSNFDLGLSARQGIRGGWELSREQGGWTYGLAVKRKGVTSDQFNANLMVNRLPELYLRTEGHPLFGNSMLADVALSVGKLREFPSKTSSQRKQAQARLRRTLIGGDESRTQLTLAVMGRYSSYDNSTYRALGYELSWQRQLDYHAWVGLGYLRYRLSGRTPFEFDDIDIARELRLETGFRVDRNWRSLVQLHYDMDTRSFRDAKISLIRTAHCLEYGFSWDTARRELGFIIGLSNY